jgi:hypothetical protein
MRVLFKPPADLLPRSPSESYRNEAELHPAGNGAAPENPSLTGATTIVSACLGILYQCQQLALSLLTQQNPY